MSRTHEVYEKSLEHLRSQMRGSGRALAFKSVLRSSPVLDQKALQQLQGLANAQNYAQFNPYNTGFNAFGGIFNG